MSLLASLYCLEQWLSVKSASILMDKVD